MALTSVAGLVSLLDNKRQDVKAFALNRLNEMVDEFWAEISESVSTVEILYEDTNFEHNKLAALLASKVYYHLAEYKDALYFALCAQELFDINTSSEFVESIISECIDKYTELRVTEDSPGSVSINLARQTSASDRTWSMNSATYKRLEQVVNSMFERCLEHKQFKHAIGIAIETRRLDMFKKAILLAEDREAMLQYAFRVVIKLSDSVRLRNQLLDVLVSIFKSDVTYTDAINVCQCLVLIDNPQATAGVLEHLLLQSPEAAVAAYQIGFDLYENSTQMFLQRLRTALSFSPKFKHLLDRMEKDRKLEDKKTIVPASSDAASTTEKTSKTTEEDTGETSKPASATDGGESAVEGQDGSTTIEPLPAALALEPLSETDKEIQKRLANLLSILTGDKVIELHLQFLIRNNRADLRLLDRMREEVKHSVTHNSTVLANGLMHCGTTSDQFLRENLNWLGKAANWSKFNATATLGVIHRGHEKEALRLMSAYLPKDTSGSSGSVYTEGGGLFALGLIHANHGGSMIEYLLNQLKDATAEPVRHGVCLGLGLAAMGTAREDVYDQIKLNLYQDDAVTGEAAGIAIGLVMLGTASVQAIDDLLSYAKETAHEKIIRGIALGIAMVMYGRLEEADELIDKLIVDNDPILRWSGVATIAMAYCGSGNNRAVERLLHAAVSDTNDDVRRWAVTALGFILFKNPDQVPSLVSLLAESYHPHLRFGAAMAIGVACAGTAHKEAVSMLETLYEGTVAFVRQGALVASAMVLMQQNGVTSPKSTEFREKCLKIICDRHEDLLAKFGATLACGILDAGGCNMTISLQTRTGNTNMTAAVGLLVFQNFWFWYPFVNFISLAFTPTALIALNKDLQMPKMQFRSNAKPATFSYPQQLQPEKEKKREKVEPPTLSFTAKQRKKEADKKQQKTQEQVTKTTIKEEKMDVDPPAEVTGETSKASTESKEKEANFCLLNNPARVLRAQQRVISLPESSRYTTLKPITTSGILMVFDKRPEDAEVFVETVHGHGPTSERTAGSTASATIGVASVGDSQNERIHASTIGACLDDEEDDNEDEEDGDVDEEEEEFSETHEDDEEDEEEDEEVIRAVVMSLNEVFGDNTGTAENAPPGTSTATRSKKPSGTREKSKHSTSSTRHASKGGAGVTEVKPPEPFQYSEETADSGTAGASSASATARRSSTTAEPMDVDSKSSNKDSDGKPDTDKHESDKK